MKPDRNIFLLMALIAVLVTLYLYIDMGGRMDKYEQGSITPEKNETKGVIRPEINQEQNNYTVLVPKDVCEGCHMSGKSSIPQALTVSPHQNGGKYCLTCHKITHQEHPMSEKGVSCEACHGKKSSPGKPVLSNGSISCNNCHNFPDALSPSGGNIITIHRPREISCNKCHTDNCLKCHTELGSSARWEKRSEHFNLVAKRRGS